MQNKMIMQNKRDLFISILAFGILFFLGGCIQTSFTTSQEAQFARMFDIQDIQDDLVFTEQYNDYGAFPYEGIALYTFSIDPEQASAWETWEPLPFSAETEDFLEGISDYVTLPALQYGIWRLIPRGPTDLPLHNASFCVIDLENGIGYYITKDL